MSAAAPRIAALTIYPIKGCRGIAVDHARADDTGLAAGALRDREWMIVDGDGRFVTQREFPRLALIEPALAGGRFHIAGPGQPALAIPFDSIHPARDVVVWRSHVRGFDAGDAAAEWLTTYLGTSVRLVRFDPSKERRCNPDFVGNTGAHTMFADGYPVLVIGSASLDDLNARLQRKGEPALPMNRFRPNVVVEGLPAYDEDHLDTMSIGAVTLKFVKPCTRCQVTTTDQITAQVGIEPLPTLSTYRRNDRLAGVTFGMNAIVVAGAGRDVTVGAPAQVSYRF